MACTALCKSYRRPGDSAPVEVLRGADLTLEAGDFVAVRGASGAGKSTLLWVAGALMRPDVGTVSIDGEDPYSMNAERRARFRADKIGFVFQQFHLVPYLSVLDNILAAALARPGDAAKTRARAEELIGTLNIDHRVHHVPSELSTGERQRAALARALLNEPALLLADEPTGNLDPDNAAAVMKYLVDFADNGGAVLLVTHDQKAAAAARRHLILEEGRLVEERPRHA